MSVGVAFSGGGISAAIGAACAWNAIADVYPSMIDSSSKSNLTISTVSGGSIGYGLWTNAKDKMHFSTYRRNVTLEDLLLEKHILKSGNAPEMWCESQRNGTAISVGEFANRLRTLPFVNLFSKSEKKFSGTNETHWWTSLIRRIFDIVCVGNIQGGEIPWISSFAFMDEAPMPTRNPEQGTLIPSSARMLHHVHANMLPSGMNSIGGNTNLSVIEALSYTSAFWAAPLLTTHTLPRALFGNLLLRANHSAFDSSSSTKPPPPNKNSAFILDGGVIDTTGIVGLLQRQTEHIIAFYNNNIPLSKLRSPIAYLFGINATTDSMNSLLGPTLSQVFPWELYPAVIVNLTNPAIGVARLAGINILRNEVLGVEPYVLKSLVIFSNAKNDNFILDDRRILNRLSPSWPDHYAFAPPRLDANALCLFNDWKVRNHQGALDPLLRL